MQEQAGEHQFHLKASLLIRLIAFCALLKAVIVLCNYLIAAMPQPNNNSIFLGYSLGPKTEGMSLAAVYLLIAITTFAFPFLNKHYLLQISKCTHARLHFTTTLLGLALFVYIAPQTLNDVYDMYQLQTIISEDYKNNPHVPLLTFEEHENLRQQQSYDWIHVRNGNGYDSYYKAYVKNKPDDPGRYQHDRQTLINFTKHIIAHCVILLLALLLINWPKLLGLIQRKQL